MSGIEEIDTIKVVKRVIKAGDITFEAGDYNVSVTGFRVPNIPSTFAEYEVLRLGIFSLLKPYYQQRLNEITPITQMYLELHPDDHQTRLGDETLVSQLTRRGGWSHHTATRYNSALTGKEIDQNGVFIYAATGGRTLLYWDEWSRLKIVGSKRDQS